MKAMSNQAKFKLGSFGLQSAGFPQGQSDSLDGCIERTLTPAGVVFCQSTSPRLSCPFHCTLPRLPQSYRPFLANGDRQSLSVIYGPLHQIALLQDLIP